MTAPRVWTAVEIERFHDGDLPPADHAALLDAMMADAALRARLERVRSVDRLARRALLEPAEAPADAPPARRAGRAPAHRFAVAATLLIAAGAAVAALILLPSPDREDSPVAAIDDSPEQGAPSTGASRGVVLVLDLPRRSIADAPSFAGARSGARRDPSALDAALLAGDRREAVRLLVAAPDGRESLEADFERVGALLASAETALEAIEALPASRRIEAVRVWSRRPALRPVMFAQLAAMEFDPATAESARALRAELAQIPELRPWLASYAARHAP